jgi:hypothetical protein
VADAGAELIAKARVSKNEPGMEGGLMSIEGIKFCDLCGDMILSDDVAPIRMEKDGHLSQLHFHNRHDHDCLAQQIYLLEAQCDAALV